jgi:hypothetical protein
MTSDDHDVDTDHDHDALLVAHNKGGPAAAHCRKTFTVPGPGPVLCRRLALPLRLSGRRPLHVGPSQL